MFCTPLSCAYSPAPDRQYGALMENGSWTGIVGEVLRSNANVLAVALDHSYERTKVLDFVSSFQFNQ